MSINDIQTLLSLDMVKAGLGCVGGMIVGTVFAIVVFYGFIAWNMYDFYKTFKTRKIEVYNRVLRFRSELDGLEIDLRKKTHRSKTFKRKKSEVQ